MTARHVVALLALAALLLAFSVSTSLAAEASPGRARHNKAGFKDAGTTAATISKVAVLDPGARGGKGQVGFKAVNKGLTAMELLSIILEDRYVPGLNFLTRTCSLFTN